MDSLSPLMMTLVSLLFILVSLFFSPKLTFKKESQKNLSNFIDSKEFFKLSLFLSFDPKSSINILFQEMNWIIIFLVSATTFLSFWSNPSSIFMSFSKFLKGLKDQFKIALKNNKDGSAMIFISLFTLILLSNFIGLVPNMFTSTSHFTLNIWISLPFWMGFLLFGWWTYSKKMFAHLVPNGTPLPLMSFMVLIELISTSIRPFTLSIRLMANMVSGHLLLTLLGNSMVFKDLSMVLFILVIQCLLSTLEIAVSVIQAYVFCILLTLYSDDSDYSK